jgi:hypothetical protein
MVKFVRTPAILTNAADCLGYPVLRRAQISVVVLEDVRFSDEVKGPRSSSDDLPSDINNQNFSLILFM